jgi:hypothetical protein
MNATRGRARLRKRHASRPPGLRRAEVASATQAGAPIGEQLADGPPVRPYHTTP